MKRIALALAALLPAAALAAWTARETPGAASFRVEAAVDGWPVDFTTYARGGVVRVEGGHGPLDSVAEGTTPATVRVLGAETVGFASHAGGRPVRVVLVDHAGRPEAGYRGRRIVLLRRRGRFVPGSAPYPLHPR
jgi:hypothetical protein